MIAKNYLFFVFQILCCLLFFPCASFFVQLVFLLVNLYLIIPLHNAINYIADCLINYTITTIFYSSKCDNVCNVEF